MQIDPAGFKAALGAANRLNQGVSLASAWGFETILTCLLVYTVFAATDTQRAKETAHLPVHLSVLTPVQTVECQPCQCVGL